MLVLLRSLGLGMVHEKFLRSKEALMGDRYLEKMKAFIRTPGLQQERMEDLLRRIKANLPALEEWLSEAEDHWGEEDGVYRFYQTSFRSSIY